MHVHSFAPNVDGSSRVLILGSMPGKVSLLAGQYYAHPRNLFWRFMEHHVGVPVEAPYEERVAHLLSSGVALWDVLKSCTRASSLDSDIVSSSIVPNDFAGLFAAYPSLRTVCFNGRMSESSFRKHVLPTLDDADGMGLYGLPSTSPANASIPLDTKLDAWSVVARARQSTSSA